jgi:hypothetical protein
VRPTRDAAAPRSEQRDLERAGGLGVASDREPQLVAILEHAGARTVGEAEHHPDRMPRGRGLQHRDPLQRAVARQRPRLDHLDGAELAQVVRQRRPRVDVDGGAVPAAREQDPLVLGLAEPDGLEHGVELPRPPSLLEQE